MGIQVINPPTNVTISNPAIINGVAHFSQPTNPTARIINGVSSPLVVGDTNYRPDLQLNTFWNGTYWVGDLCFTEAAAFSDQFFRGMSFLDRNAGDNLIFVEKCHAYCLPGTSTFPSGSANDYTEFSWNRFFSGSSEIAFFAKRTYLMGNGRGFSEYVGTALLVTGFKLYAYRMLNNVFAGFVTPSAYRLQISYRNIIL